MTSEQRYWERERRAEDDRTAADDPLLEASRADVARQIATGQVYQAARLEADAEDLEALECAADLLAQVLAAARCPTCGGECAYLGALGPLHWLRCRACGMEHHRAAP